VEKAQKVLMKKSEKSKEKEEREAEIEAMRQMILTESRQWLGEEFDSFVPRYCAKFARFKKRWAKRREASLKAAVKKMQKKT